MNHFVSFKVYKTCAAEVTLLTNRKAFVLNVSEGVS